MACRPRLRGSRNLLFLACQESLGRELLLLPLPQRDGPPEDVPLRKLLRWPGSQRRLALQQRAVHLAPCAGESDSTASLPTGLCSAGQIRWDACPRWPATTERRLGTTFRRRHRSATAAARGAAAAAGSAAARTANAVASCSLLCVACSVRAGAAVANASADIGGVLCRMWLWAFSGAAVGNASAHIAFCAAWPVWVAVEAAAAAAEV